MTHSAPKGWCDGLSREDLVARLWRAEAPGTGGRLDRMPDADSLFVSPTLKSNIQPEAKVVPRAAKSRAPRRKERPFDFGRHGARPVAFKVAYLGWNYHGLASQEQDSVETIESHLFRALTTAKLIPDRKSCMYSRCGRTDKGVSAFGQVVALRVRTALALGTPGVYSWGDSTAAPVSEAGGVGLSDSHMRPPGSSGDTSMSTTEELKEELPYLSILNRLLPADIRVLAWSPVSAHFNARFDCSFRRYKYYFPSEGLSLDRMQDAARLLVGTHDYRNFCKVDPLRALSYERTILGATVRLIRSGDDWLDPGGSPIELAGHISVEGRVVESSPSAPPKFLVFEVKGQAFLWHQVRCMMAVLLLVGRGKEDPAVVAALLDMARQPRSAQGHYVGRPTYEMADDLPLVLAECGYPEGVFQWTHISEGSSRGAATPSGVLGRMLDYVKAQWREQSIKSLLFGHVVLDLCRQTSNNAPAGGVADGMPQLLRVSDSFLPRILPRMSSCWIYLDVTQWKRGGTDGWRPPRRAAPAAFRAKLYAPTAKTAGKSQKGQD